MSARPKAITHTFMKNLLCEKKRKSREGGGGGGVVGHGVGVGVGVADGGRKEKTDAPELSPGSWRSLQMPFFIRGTSKTSSPTYPKLYQL